MKTSCRQSAQINASSMADIAFLLLTFFLVTTIIPTNKGIALLLPQHTDQSFPIHERNIFKIQINSHDQYLINGQERNGIKGMREELKKFILNNDEIKTLSESPEKAIVSFKTDRGTSYQAFISTLDEIQAAYFEIYSDRVHLTPAEYRALDHTVAKQQELYDLGRRGIPMNISIAEPTQTFSEQ